MLAVNCPPQAPGPGHAAASTASSCASSIVPAACEPIASNTCRIVISFIDPSGCCSFPGAIEPPYSISPGIFKRASAMIAAGMFLSQPAIQTSPSKELPRLTSSIESAITSREISEAFMPSVPIVMPSWIVTVLNSMGVPPASRTPCFTASATCRR